MFDLWGRQCIMYIEGLKGFYVIKIIVSENNSFEDVI